MDPSIGRVAFNLGLLLVFLTLLPLPFLDTGSAEFIVGVLALLFSLAFLIYVVYDVRKQVKRSVLNEEK